MRPNLLLREASSDVYKIILYSKSKLRWYECWSSNNFELGVKCDQCPDHTNVFRMASAVKLLGVLLRSKCWSTIFHAIIVIMPMDGAKGGQKFDQPLSEGWNCKL